MQELVELSDASSEVPEDPEELGPGEFFEELELGFGQAPELELPIFELEAAPTSEPVVSACEWDAIVSSGYGRFRQPVPELALPWETGVLSDIFGSGERLSLPSVPLQPVDAVLGLGMAQAPSQVQPLSLPQLSSPCFERAVRKLDDLGYFTNKNLQREKACGVWMDLLSVSWDSSTAGVQIRESLRKDPSGDESVEILKAVFGTKSPGTVLKRAASVRTFVRWYERLFSQFDWSPLPFPFTEEAVWKYFLHLREGRQSNLRGYTVPGAFLEALRFVKYTVGLGGVDEVLCSRRILGIAAIEKSLKGPVKQAPPLSLRHVKKLHEILDSGPCDMDRLGAGAFLLCLYARARWSDLRYINHVDLELNSGYITLYTAEHKTSNIGERREQFLPLIVPWEGVVDEPWLQTFLAVYESLGLNIHQVPLGPLLPAPRRADEFGARPLTTGEAAVWLRELLKGVDGSEQLRAHSLKATLLLWCAQAGLDKETRAVLGHHCTALQGSDVVYSRHLQTRAMRKLSLLLHSIRLGKSAEEGEVFPMTPAAAGLRDPAAPPVVAEGRVPDGPDVQKALDAIQLNEDLVDAKEESFDERILADAAERLSLFPVPLVSSGVVAIDSSSGSSSSSSSSSSEDTEDLACALKAQDEDRPVFATADPGEVFYRHRKSGVVHRSVERSQATKCKAKLSQNFVRLGSELHMKLPKCLKRFPGDPDRVRTVEQMTGALDRALARISRPRVE